MTSGMGIGKRKMVWEWNNDMRMEQWHNSNNGMGMEQW